MSSFMPSKAILPVLLMDADGTVKELLGTSFCVSMNGLFLTAGHVFHRTPVADKQWRAGGWRVADDDVHFLRIDRINSSDKHDIASFWNDPQEGLADVPLTRRKVSVSADVLAYEYSSTKIEALQSGAKQITFSPYTHKGNVMRHHLGEQPDRLPTPSFDASFPALQGASGAPVLRQSDFVVVGMLVANLERHLLPAQVVKIQTDDDYREETSYFLPLGQGLQAELLVDFLEESGAPIRVVP